MASYAMTNFAGNAADAPKQIALRLFENGFGWEDAARSLIYRRRGLMPSEQQEIRRAVYALWREHHRLPARVPA